MKKVVTISVGFSLHLISAASHRARSPIGSSSEPTRSVKTPLNAPTSREISSRRRAFVPAGDAFGSAIAYELRNTGVDVLTLVPSSVNTETYQRAEQQRSRVFPPMDVRDFVVSALDALGSRWVAVPGRRNAITADVLGRLLPRRSATSMMGRNLEKMLGAG